MICIHLYKDINTYVNDNQATVHRPRELGKKCALWKDTDIPGKGKKILWVGYGQVGQEQEGLAKTGCGRERDKAGRDGFN